MRESHANEVSALSVMDVARYPTLVRYAKAPDRLRRWMDVLAAGHAAGQIRNVEYQDAKSTADYSASGHVVQRYEATEYREMKLQ